MSRSQFDQEFKFRQQLASMKEGRGEEEIEVAGVELSIAGYWYLAGLVLALLVGGTSFMFGNAQLAVLCVLFAIGMAAMIMISRRKQLEEQFDARELQYKEFQMKKGDARYWGRGEDS